MRARLSGGLTTDRNALVDALGPAAERLNPADSYEPLDGARLEGERARAARAVLRRHGIVAEPTLTAAQQPVVLRSTRRYAVLGAIGAAIAAGVVGAADYWVYGLIFAIAGALAACLLATRWAWLDRVVPSFVARGYALGLAVAGVLLLVAALGGAVPVRAHRQHEGDVAAAQKLVQSAREAITRHDFVAAFAYLDVAARRPIDQRIVARVRAEAVAAQARFRNRAAGNR